MTRQPVPIFLRESSKKKAEPLTLISSPSLNKNQSKNNGCSTFKKPVKN